MLKQLVAGFFFAPERFGVYENRPLGRSFYPEKLSTNGGFEKFPMGQKILTFFLCGNPGVWLFHAEIKAFI